MTRDAVEEARRGGANPIGGLDEETTRLMFCNDMDEADAVRLDRTGHEHRGRPRRGEISTSASRRPCQSVYVHFTHNSASRPTTSLASFSTCVRPRAATSASSALDTEHNVMIEPRRSVLADVLNRIAATTD